MVKKTLTVCAQFDTLSVQYSLRGKITDTKLADTFLVSPNLALNNVNISYEINIVHGTAKIDIRNVLGQVVFSSHPLT